MFNVLKATNDVTDSDIFQILSLPISSDRANEDPKNLWKQEGENKKKICKQKLISTFNPVPEEGEVKRPEFVESIQRQNDQLSKQVAEVENENLKLRDDVEKLTQQVADVEQKKQKLDLANEKQRSVPVPLRPASPNIPVELSILAAIFLFFLCMGYFLA